MSDSEPCLRIFGSSRACRRGGLIVRGRLLHDGAHSLVDLKIRQVVGLRSVLGRHCWLDDLPVCKASEQCQDTIDPVPSLTLSHSVKTSHCKLALIQ